MAGTPPPPDNFLLRLVASRATNRMAIARPESEDFKNKNPSGKKKKKAGFPEIKIHLVKIKNPSGKFNRESILSRFLRKYTLCYQKIIFTPL